MRVFYTSDAQMDDPEMEELQDRDDASCAVWEWLKCDASKRGTDEVRELSAEETLRITKRLGIDPQRFRQIIHQLVKLKWITKGRLRNWAKYQAGRTANEDALRKQVEYWRLKFEETLTLLSKTSQNTRTSQKSQTSQNPRNNGKTTGLSLNPSAEEAAQLSDDEWMESLQRQDCYKHLEIRKQHQRMVNWCNQNRRQPTRRRFINWINHCDKPMKPTVAARHNSEGLMAPGLFE